MSRKYIEATSEGMLERCRQVKRVIDTLGLGQDIDQADWEEHRKVLDYANQQIPCAEGVVFRKMRSERIHAVISEPEKVREDNVIMYIHGGGFLSGSAETSKSYTSALAKAAECRVVAIDYALAPENPAPAAIIDCSIAFLEIATHHPNAMISLVGDGTGANLALALAHIMKDTGKIASVSVHSPMIDFSECLDRTQHEIHDDIIKLDCMAPVIRMYVKENYVKNPSISPYYGNFKKFPPVFITCDSNETLYADANALSEKCEEAGVEFEFIEVRGAFHNIAKYGIGTEESDWILKENAAFITKHGNYILD